MQLPFKLGEAFFERRQQLIVGKVIELAGTTDFRALDAMATPKVLGSTLPARQGDAAGFRLNQLE